MSYLHVHSSQLSIIIIIIIIICCSRSSSVSTDKNKDKYILAKLHFYCKIKLIFDNYNNSMYLIVAFEVKSFENK